MIELSASQRTELEKIVNKRTSPQQLVLRARIILLTAEGMSVDTIAQKLATSKATISKWKKRFLEAGVSGLFGFGSSGQTCEIWA